MSSIAFGFTVGGRDYAANSGIGWGSQIPDETQDFSQASLAQTMYIGNPVGLLPAIVFETGPPDRNMQYVQAAADLAPGAETGVDSGLFNATGVTVPEGAYFWALTGEGGVPTGGFSDGFDLGFDT